MYANAMVERMHQKCLTWYVHQIYKQLILPWWMKLWMNLLQLFVLCYMLLIIPPRRLHSFGQDMFFPKSVANWHQPQAQAMA
jgi:hypothetical protein